MYERPKIFAELVASKGVKSYRKVLQPEAARYKVVAITVRLIVSPARRSISKYLEKAADMAVFCTHSARLSTWMLV
jgi:hypothetical protein